MSAAKPKPFNLAAVAAGFRSVFADPRAKVCFGSVFFEGIVIHGMFPYVALLLLATGADPILLRRPGDRAVSGSAASSIRWRCRLLVALCERAAIDADRRRLRRHRLRPDRAELALVRCWPRCFVLFGARLLHAARLHPASRHRTVARPRAARRCRCIPSAFFTGQAIGPIYYGYAFGHVGTSMPPSDRRGRDHAGRVGLLPLPAPPPTRRHAWRRGVIQPWLSARFTSSK